MDDKKKWWERSAWVRTTKDKGSTSDAGDDGQRDGPGHFEGGGAAADPLAVAPGAFAVHGPGYHGEDDDDDDLDGDVREGGGRHGDGLNVDDDEATDAPLQVDSYAVKDGPTDEEIRQQILAGTAHAEAVTIEPPKARRNRSAALLLVVAGVVVVVVAVVVGVTVPLATRSQSTDPSAQGPDEDVVASFKYLEWQGSGGFANSIQAQTRQSDGTYVTTGLFESIWCKAKPCLVSDESCVVGETYAPGCCAGADCPNETKCGEYCPNPPESCYLTDPNNKDCIRSSCYTCNEEDGKVMYQLTDYAWEIDCLQVGTAIRPDNGQTYKWAIICGPVILGPVVEDNRDLGEYQCAALRLGANFSDESGGLASGTYPCQYLALAECGCGPSDMYTFGLPDPTGPCLPESGCPILCEEAGPQYARNACRSFPGNISWWEGQNVFNSSLFRTDTLAPEYEFEMYVKGIDSED